MECCNACDAQFFGVCHNHKSLPLFGPSYPSTKELHGSVGCLVLKSIDLTSRIRHERLKHRCLQICSSTYGWVEWNKQMKPISQIASKDVAAFAARDREREHEIQILMMPILPNLNNVTSLTSELLLLFGVNNLANYSYTTTSGQSYQCFSIVD